MTAHSPPNDSQWLSNVAFLVIGLCAVTVFLSIAAYFAGAKPFFGVWEDALMLSRYAHNLTAFGRVEWNPDGQPTYGLTGPYYFLSVVMAVAKFITAKPLAIPVVASVISGLLFILATALTLPRLLPGPSQFRHIAMALVAVSLARNANGIAVHFVSGMDTLFALFYFTIYIALAAWHSRALTWSSASVAGLWGGLAFGTRPDLLIWTALVPASFLLLGSGRRQKRLGGFMLASTVFLLALQIAVAVVYFHSPLPLPFYAKSLQLYADLSGFRLTAFQHFAGFLICYWLLFLVIALDLAVDPRGWWHDTSPLIKALSFGVVLHMGYFLLGVTQIMPESQRFYYPSLPALLFLAGCATVRLLGRMPNYWSAAIAHAPKHYRYAAIAAALLVLPPPYIGELSLFGELAHRRVPSFDLTQEYRAYLANYWFALDRFSALPSQLSMATTEVGHVGAMNLDKTVVDTAGLNDPLFVHRRFSAADFFAHYHPDLIYMPHPGYRAMNASFETNPTFQRDYDWFPADTLGAETMGIALSRSSKYYPEMRRIVDEVCAERRAGPCKLGAR